MVFGDGSPDGVYRGMGRGLGRLLLSPRFDSIISYLIANVAGGLLSTDTVAWGSKADDLIWSSFGYASLSMGRDRYLEYAAERIARSSVKHVLDGFRQEGSTHGDQQQLAELWQYKQADELTRAGLAHRAGQRHDGGGLRGRQHGAAVVPLVSWALPGSTEP